MGYEGMPAFASHPWQNHGSRKSALDHRATCPFAIGQKLGEKPESDGDSVYFVK
jgi:hypothetical protein